MFRCKAISCYAGACDMLSSGPTRRGSWGQDVKLQHPWGKTIEMKRSAFALTLVVLLCSGSLAQERETRERTREGQRRGERDRREYRPEERSRRQLAVKDPAGFKTAGKQIFSGPQPGEKLPVFKATSLAGDNNGKELDPTRLAGNKRQVLFFQDVSRTAIAGLLSVMDAIGKIERKTDKDLQIACVFLVDDADRIRKGLTRAFPLLLERGVDVVAVSQGGRDGPGAYGLNRTISQTIILAGDGKVTRNFVFPEPLLYADPHVLGGVAELIGEKRETVTVWLNEATAGERPRSGDDLARRQRALGGKLRGLVEAGKLTREEAGVLYRAAFPERQPAGGGGNRKSRERDRRDRDGRKREKREDR